MVTTQSFRLIGKPDLKDIVCDQVDGENVVFWEDIEQVFPGVKYITNGNTVIGLMRDSSRKRITPQCIKHYPGVVLDVVLSTTASGGLFEPFLGDSSVTLTEERSSTPAMTLNLDQEMVQRLASSLSPKVQAQLKSTSNGYEIIAHAVKEGQLDLSDILRRCFQEFKTEMTRNIQLSSRVVELIEKKGQQEQSPNQLDQLRRRVQSVLNQNYELYEKPPPRLFIVLPLLHRHSNDSQGSFSNTFRLHFLCDCGEHTMSPNSKTSHHIHFAKHEGYDIIRPDEFFKKYGSYVLTILRMLKFGISVAGITVPAVSRLVNADDECRIIANRQLLAGTIESGMDLIMEYIETVLECEGNAKVEFEELVDNAVPLAIEDLHQLEGFLKKKDDDVLANLYRSVTTDGHVKWVCVDHYRERHQKKCARALHDAVDDIEGSFDENAGCVSVCLPSRREAEMFYLALEKAKGVCDLNIGFKWNTTHQDFKRLRDTLAKTNIGVLELDLGDEGSLGSDCLNLTKCHDHVFDIMRHPTIQSVTIVRTPGDFTKRSNLVSSNGDFHNLRHLSMGLTSMDLDLDIPGFKHLLSKAPNLSHLILNGELDSFLQLYSAIAEQQTCTITFSDASLRILPPTSKPVQSTTPLPDLASLLQVHGERIETVKLDEDELNEATVAVFAKATEKVSRLKELVLGGSDLDLGEKCIHDLAGIVARSELRKIDMHLYAEEERVQILESIQWEYLRQLEIGMDDRVIGMGPLKALVDGIESLSERPQVEGFVLIHEHDEGKDISNAQERLLCSFLNMTSLKHLTLHVSIRPKRVQVLLESANVTRLQYFYVYAREFTPDDVDAILDGLRHAVELREVRLEGSDFTDEQEEQMKRKGITLSNAMIF